MREKRGRYRRLQAALILLGMLAWIPTGMCARPRESGNAANGEAQLLSPQGKAELRKYLQSGTVPGLRWPDFRDDLGEVIKFYRSFGNNLAWVRNGEPTPQALAMIEALETADRKGLDPNDYDGSRWKKRLMDLRQRSRPSTESALVRFDIELTVCAMRYASDLRNGRMNPHQPTFALSIDGQRYALADYLARRVVRAKNIKASLTELEPLYQGYRRTLTALHRYRQLAAKEKGGRLPVTRKAVVPGQPYAGVPELARRLRLLGDLPATVDVSPSAISYQGPLVAAVRHFQSRHGLAPDGKIGPQTFRQLNTPLAWRVVQLQLALERWRWLPKSLEPPWIVVDIPEFQLHAENGDGRWVFSMKVVVGKAVRNETPVFLSAIKSIIFRPNWTVPEGITSKELLPKIEKNPAYLAENHYQIVGLGGKALQDSSPNQATLEELRTGRLKLRQMPGPTNSLGLVKFDMPNDYQVYMHGTPDAKLFQRSRRDFSHGCIRVKNPTALAEWLLHDQPEWNLDRIRDEMDGDETVRVPLSKPVPVLILYTTATVAESGEVHFAPDIYRRDRSLEKALKNRYARRESGR